MLQKKPTSNTINLTVHCEQKCKSADECLAREVLFDAMLKTMPSIHNKTTQTNHLAPHNCQFLPDYCGANMDRHRRPLTNRQDLNSECENCYQTSSGLSKNTPQVTFLWVKTNCTILRSVNVISADFCLFSNKWEMC